MKRRLLVSLLLLSLPALCQAQFAAVVNDPINTAQSVINTARELLQQVQIYERQYEQLRAAWTLIQGQVQMIETALKNLQRLPEGLNFVDLLSLKGSELLQLLNATEGLSFTLDQATQQFTQTYMQLSCTASMPEIQAAYQRMQQLRMGSTKSAIQLQSIQTNVLDAFTRLCALLAGSVAAQGNLDVQQIQAQQLALTMQQKAQADAAQAASERVRAMRSAEDMVKAEMTRCLQERFFVTGTTPPYVADGRLQTLHTFR